MSESYPVYMGFNQKLLMIGFGSIGQSVLPLILRHIEIKPEQITIIAMHDDRSFIAKNYGVSFHLERITPDNYESVLENYLQEGDFLLNLSVGVSSLDLIKFCRRKQILYLDTCIEPWEGGYTDSTLSPSSRSNYALRKQALQINENLQGKASTALITHGANPGLVSHFVKEALLNLAKDLGLSVAKPRSRQEWAALAQRLSIRTIHIAEYDTQISSQPKNANEFVNTWSIDGFISEGLQPAELGWGTHERHWPYDAHYHDDGSHYAIYLSCPGASVRVRTWTPLAGAFHGFLITHSESISISDYFTLIEKNLTYRPTVHYAYHPCQSAVLSLDELAGGEWQPQKNKRLLMDEITEGIDELGVLLMGHPRGAYWFGSQLSIHEARQLVPYNNATSLQVAASVLAGMIWSLEHPNCGVVEPDDIDHEYILTIARPYLGQVGGFYTDWNPIRSREALFKEKLDRTDPWQFINIRVE